MRAFLPPLALTLALELPIALLFGVKGKDLLLCALVNVLTNPLVNLLYPLFPSFWLLLALECAAVGAEGWIYRACGENVRRPFLLSLTANTVSFCLGSFLLAI